MCSIIRNGCCTTTNELEETIVMCVGCVKALVGQLKENMLVKEGINLHRTTEGI